ncbi:hypothetical protein GCM10009721_00420 [Terrabacter tumescens]|uniref:DUF5671 domain-containing protein n=1 Tax=Terrabacter tumescens TaxID=60443 RepID=A0ABQ2HH61_9MICO|nr:DUF5671 domain-containing protein [Terrabacter tumescens]GGM79891.1 hypothetical protein GCM10009721_00420 [Terrabacter tumescens]
MVGSLVIALVVIAVAVWGGRRALARGGSPHVTDGASVRRFFTYAVLLGLLFVAGNGVVGLLARVLDPGNPTEYLEGLDEMLAQQTAFAVVGVPLYVVVAAWTRSRVRDDPSEAASRGFTFYLTAAQVVSLVLTLLAVQATVGWALGAPQMGAQFAELLVWGGSWLAHRFVERRVVGRDVLTVAGLLGAALGLGFTAAGVVMLVAHVVGQVLQIPSSQTAMDPSLLQLGVMTLVAGLPVWAVCWVVPARRLQRGTLWHVLVLLVGVAGGLLTAVVGASVALDRVVVWLVRGTGADATAQLQALPPALGALLVGSLVWLYHRSVLRAGGTGPDTEPGTGPETAPDTGRTEVRRAYDYLLAGVGLVAAAVGLVVMIVAGVEGLSGTDVVLVGGSDPVDTVIAAGTLLVLGGPVWWLFWRRLERAEQADPVAERRSGSRRVYVLLLFGVAGVAAVAALLFGVVGVLQDVFAGSVGPQTLQNVRYPLGIIVTSGLVAAYHWTVLRADRGVLGEQQHGPRYVLLVGPADPDVAREAHARTGGVVNLVARTDVEAAPWPVDELAATLAGLPDAGIVVVADDKGGLRTIPVTPP